MFDDNHNAKKLGKAMSEFQKTVIKTGYQEKNYDNPFKEYTDKLADTLYKKNQDYGSSFDRVASKIGHKALLIRLMDKYNRIEHLILNGEDDKAVDESLKDTLLDLAGYSILSLKFLDNEEKKQK